MTRKEALQILDTIPTIGEQVDALEMAIKALEQEPCERFEWGIDGKVYKITKAKDGKEICQQVCNDAISRQAVLDTISELNAISFYEAQEDSKECYYEIEQAVENMPPVTPQLPDNATNGEIMQMIFPSGVTAKFATFMRFVVGEDEYFNCAYDWWNAPYQKGGKE